MLLDRPNPLLRRKIHEKRQRVSSAVEPDDETPARPRSSAVVTTSSTARGRGRQTSTTPPPAPPPTTTRSVVTTPQPVPVTVSSAPVVTSAISVPPVATTTSARAISVPAVVTTSAETTASRNDANSAVSTTSSSSLHPGAVAGIVVGIVALLALIGGFFAWRRKKKNANVQLTDLNFSSTTNQSKNNGYKREKSMDGSDLFPGGLKQRSSAVFNEKENFKMQPIQKSPFDDPPHLSKQQSVPTININPGSGHSSFVPAAQPIASFPSQQFNDSSSIRSSYAPIKAAMMGSPSTRSSVANPYHAIKAAGIASPPLPSMPTMPVALPSPIDMPAQQGDSPFSDPQWANKVFVVSRTFEPSMPDELVIYPGDKVRILMAYDDGWVLGENLSSVEPGSTRPPNRGVFPRDCIDSLDSEMPAATPDNAEEDSTPLNPEPASVQRAPTLPPLNLRDSVSLTDQMAKTKRDSRRMSTQSKSAIQQRQSTVLTPTIEISEDGDTMPSQPKHDSHTSSLNATTLDRFPITPSRQLSPVTESDAADMDISDEAPIRASVKRTSSLMASKDADLFKALGMNDLADHFASQEAKEAEERQDAAEK